MKSKNMENDPLNLPSFILKETRLTIENIKINFSMYKNLYIFNCILFQLHIDNDMCIKIYSQLWLLNIFEIITYTD